MTDPYPARIEWLDAVHDTGDRRAWMTVDELPTCAVVTTIGWVVRETDLEVTVAGDSTGEHWSSAGAIPRACITRIVRLDERAET